MKLIDISTKKYPNLFAKVDDKDYEWLNKIKWHSHQRPNTVYVFKCDEADGVGHKKYMHRIIMGAKKGQIVDHINGDGLDNRRENLRICTQSQNLYNSKKCVGHSSSRFKGVRFHKVARKFCAELQVSKKRIYLGLFEREVDAAIAYNAAAIKHFGEFARPNKIELEE